MPRRAPRRMEDCWRCDGEGCPDCGVDVEEQQEPEDVRVAPGIPTLKEVRRHITEHKWNGGECEGSMCNEDVFVGQCEYASTAISEMLSADPKKTDWSKRVRGWYKGDLSLIKLRPGCDKHAFAKRGAKHCHSWVEYNGKIYDPTYWQFGGGDVRVYEFELNDPRYVRDPEA